MNPRRNPILIFVFIAVIGIVLVFLFSSPEKKASESFGNGSEDTSVVVQTPDTWILPDSLMVYGPESVGFLVEDFLQRKNGFLSRYAERVNGVSMDASAIIQKVAEDYSVSPQLLIALIESQSGWVSLDEKDPLRQGYPLAEPELLGEGLFVQLSHTADLLNYGFYARQVGAFDWVILSDGTQIYLPEDVNAGTAGVYSFYAAVIGKNDWDSKIANRQFLSIYHDLFRDPFSGWNGSLMSDQPEQPVMQLPFESGKTWSYTGGPHSAWGRHSAWAALDFAPPKEQLGCVQNDEWVTAVANGVIVRSDEGVVILDLDGDGYEQTGWVVVYLHMETRDRIPSGTQVTVGQSIGHASCEGGYSTGTHIHIARKFNGEWIPADQSNPFNLEGWVSGGTGIEYSGTLTKQDRVIEALDGRQEKNSITR